jgi:hypothetical protein
MWFLQSTISHGMPRYLTCMLLDTFAEQGKAARDAAGWHVCLDALAQHLAGEKSILGAVWGAAHSRHEERFGPEAATVGPPRGNRA